MAVDRRKQAEEAKKRVLNGSYSATNTSSGSGRSARSQALQQYYQNQGRQSVTDQYTDARREAMERSTNSENDRIFQNSLPNELKDRSLGINSGLSDLTTDYPSASRGPNGGRTGPFSGGFNTQQEADDSASRMMSRYYQQMQAEKANPPAPPAPKRYWGQGFQEFTNEVNSALTFGVGGWLQESQNEEAKRLAEIAQNSANPSTQRAGNNLMQRTQSYDYYTPQFRDSGAGIAANIIGSLVPGQAAFDIAGLATRGIVNNLGRTAARGALGGAIYQTGNEAVDAARTGEVNPLQRGVRIGISAGLGGAADAGLSALGRGIQKAFPNAPNPLVDSPLPGQGGITSSADLNAARRVPGRPAPAPGQTEAPYVPSNFADEAINAQGPNFIGNTDNAVDRLRSRAAGSAASANTPDIDPTSPQWQRLIDDAIAGRNTPEATAANPFGDYLRNNKVKPQAAANRSPVPAENVPGAGRNAPETPPVNAPEPVLPGAGRNAPETPVPAVRTFDDTVPGAGRSAPEPMPAQMPAGAGRNAPELPAGGMRERGTVTSLAGQDKIPDEMVELLRQNPNSRYEPVNNADTVMRARAEVDANFKAAEADVLSDRPFDADKAVKAQMLIDRYNKAGDFQNAAAIADKLATEATKAGQFIQAQSLRDSLTPEGVLIRAKRIEQRINESRPVSKRKPILTDQSKAEITELASTTQQMLGTRDNANSVLDMLNAKAPGEKLTAAELSQVEHLINDSRAFIRDSTRRVRNTDTRPPQVERSPRLRDNMVTFMDAQEQNARRRIAARRNSLSSTPLDVWADYAIIGASKMTKGTVKFADWSEAMVKELGENIRPSIHALYGRSREAYDISRKSVKALQQMTPEERAVEKVLRAGKLDQTQADSLRLLAQNMSSLSGDVRRVASQDLQRILQGMENPGILRKVSAAQTIAQLLNPKTQIRNIVGNEIFYRTERINKLVATPIDIARSKLTGTDRVVTFRTNNQGQFWKNWFEGAKAGWDGVNINGLETQFELRGQAFRGKYNPMTYLEKSLGASLRGFDNAAYMRAYNNTMGELATLEAINTGKQASSDFVQNYISTADDNIRQLADDYGRYVTFQDNNLVSQGLSSLKRGLNLKQDFGVGDIVLKYPKTPGALLVRALEYSPAGFVRSAVQLTKAVKYAEEGATRQFVESLSRATIGTLGFAGMGYALMDAGVLTTASSRDRDIRTLEQGAGKGAYQINVDALKRFVSSGFDPKASGGFKEGDQLYTYDWAQPISLAFSIGSEFKKGQEEGKTADKLFAGMAGAAVNSISGSLNTLTEQSVLSGLKDAAQGYPGQTVSDKVVDILLDVPASFVPTIVNQFRQAGDNTARETYDPNKIQQSLNMVKNRIPGLAQTLPKRYDNLGNQVKVYQDPSLFNIFANPGKPSTYSPDDVAKDVLQLITETNDDTLAPRVPQKKLGGIPLTGEQFSELSRLQGLENRERLGKINRDKSTSSQVKKTERQIDKAAKYAKKDFLRAFPDLKAEIKANKK